MKTHEVTITNHYQDTITSPNDNMDTARHLFTDLSGYHSREKIVSMILDAIRDMKKDAERLRNDWDTRLAAACMDPNKHIILMNEVDRDIHKIACEQGEAIMAAMTKWNIIRANIMYRGCNGAEDREGNLISPVFDRDIIQQMARTGKHDTMISILTSIPNEGVDKSYNPS